MLKRVGIGLELFHELIASNSYYVDKTGFIRTVFQDYSSKIMLITRPRRFGKTLTMSTFCDFLSLDPSNPGDVSRQEKWFQGTSILDDHDFCREHMGRYPVIFITLKTVEGKNFADAYHQLASTVYTMYAKFRYLADSDHLSSDETGDFRQYLNKSFLMDPATGSNAVKDSLETLLRLLRIHHGIPPVLLIDEYDVPIAKAAHSGYYRDMLDMISVFLGKALKTNEDLGRAVLTGCLRAAKESIFNGLNNLQICSVIDKDDDSISQGVGFTREETRSVLAYYGLEDYAEHAARNYDGYNFGYVPMYCPWDVMSFCNANYRNVGRPGREVTVGNYWLNTSGNDVIEEFMGFISPEELDMLQDLLDGRHIRTVISPALCYGDLSLHRVKDFWTLLLFTGYLTADLAFKPEKRDEYSLYIPNEEIRDCFRTKILDFFACNPVMQNHAEEFSRGLFSGDEVLVQNCLRGLLAKYVSIRDFATNAPRENYYHGFINGLLVNGVSLIEEQKSNFESGDGYIDLIIKSSAMTEVIAVLELKQTPDLRQDKALIARKALEQITEKKYAESYVSRSDVTAVFAFGICFCRKECAVAAGRLK